MERHNDSAALCSIFFFVFKKGSINTILTSLIYRKSCITGINIIPEYSGWFSLSLADTETLVTSYERAAQSLRSDRQPRRGNYAMGATKIRETLNYANGQRRGFRQGSRGIPYQNVSFRTPRPIDKSGGRGRKLTSRDMKQYYETQTWSRRAPGGRVNSQLDPRSNPQCFRLDKMPGTNTKYCVICKRTGHTADTCRQLATKRAAQGQNRRGKGKGGARRGGQQRRQ
eukprot:SAG11_NODE_769_length_7262_cov_20.934385_5_plen_227_part_00